jgi:hypothetical protein
MLNTIHRRPPRAVALVTLLAGVIACTTLSGCSSLYTEGATASAGIAGAAIASKVTSNAAVASGIGLGVLAAAHAGVQYSERVMHTYTQDMIAGAAGPLAVGAVAPWVAVHTVPIEDDEKGRVTVSRAISTGTLDCKKSCSPSIPLRSRTNQRAARSMWPPCAVTATYGSGRQLNPPRRDGAPCNDRAL